MIEQYYKDVLGKRICIVKVYPAKESDKSNILFLSGFGQSKAGYFCMYMRLAKELAEVGYNCLLFDYPGIGDSHGNLQDFTWEDYVSVSMEIAKMQIIKEKDIIIGFGIGANIAARISLQKNIRIIGVSNWVDKYPLLKVLEEKEEIISLCELFDDPFSSNILRLMGGDKHHVRGFFAKKKMFYEISREPAFYELIGDGEILLIYGEFDITQKVRKHIEIVGNMRRHGITIRVIPGADRFFSFADWQDDVFETIIGWLG